MDKFSFKKVDFYKKDSSVELYETFLLDANDEIVLADNSQVNCSIYFKTDIYRKKTTLYVDIALYSWCNNQQDYVPLNKSIWNKDSFGGGLNIPVFETHYNKIISNFFMALEQVKYHWEIKDIIHKFKHPIFVFHYKLLNLFTRQELEEIMLTHFKSYPVFNTSLFYKRPKNQALSYLLLPNVVSGLYIDGIEISTDLDETDMPIIEDNDSGAISKKEFLNRLALLQEK